MERVAYDASHTVDVGMALNIVSIGKPPWSNSSHSGRLERLIVQLGAGNGKFSEIYGIPRSIGCIGNSSFVLRREPLSPERVRGLIREFREIGGKELWLTNYDRVEYLTSVATYASEIGVPEVYAVVKLEDVESVEPVDGVRFIAELEYSPKNVQRLEAYSWLYGALIMVRGSQLDELMGLKTTFPGEVYVDVLFPGSARKLDFNVIEVKRILNPTVERYHDCLAGTMAVTADGYALPCPLLRNYVVGDLKELGIKKVLRKRRIKAFWKMTKDEIGACSACPFRYICHDCRALEYQATSEIDGLEYCHIVF
ncbi:SPASM domain-containing protein [Thermococcus thioreducens]|uniref:Fe-S oxidoreductase n=1 Tax=Thermococcus thioreducens TaxID=277988 RepID=A0A0Q2QP50_9EURY|nr:SPASM domain-containing protein [Thermococcus thioreducens]ASJ13464.1 Fe-S oxidoreductase [Thermococcus thioreducens]KQH81653.1 Fe-S oxidoreductase [Thermococcus thioreducens]SEV96829.1 radical SAM additional 4Fe4S-binding SPASM domain-containing protein [Thermococcus thioreducens]